VPAGAVTALDIIDNPPGGSFAVAGASANGALGDPLMLANASLSPESLPQMRYDTATNTYQAKFPAGSWQTLWIKTEPADWVWANVGVGDSGNIIGVNVDRKAGVPDAYAYSSMAWFSGLSDFGTFAFGIPTSASAVPTSGSARYDGVISGHTDIFQWVDGGFPSYAALGVGGSVTLSFDFAKGTLGGSMEPLLGATSLGTYSFKNGVYSAGGYSGQFDTPVSGINSFYGQLTGPHAEELIGGWALPFHYSGDDKDHQAIGAWVAKKP
jgi:hypothetical protein